MNLCPVSAIPFTRKHSKLYVYRPTKPPRYTPEELEHRRVIRQRLKNQRKRAKLRASGGRPKVADITFLFDAQKSRCFYCTKKIKGNGYHIDHFIPIARGGRNERGNLRLACPQCNIAKSDQPPEQFMGLMLA